MSLPEPAVWFVIAGALLVGIALAGSVLKRLPLTAAMFYVAAGAALGPWGAGLLHIDALRDAELLERFTEVAVIISLFTAGLKLRLPGSDRRWRPAILLASFAMLLTVAAIAAFAVLVLGFPLSAAVLLGAILAPTDPVLASDVQVEHAGDAEPLRFSLTAEAGLNDGTAFPFVMLGLGLMGAHELGDYGWRWATIDLAGRCSPGLASPRSAVPQSHGWCSTCARSIARPWGSTNSWPWDSSRSRTALRCPSAVRVSRRLRGGSVREAN